MERDCGDCHLSVFDSQSRPPRNSTRRLTRKSRACFKRPPSFVEDCWKSYCKSTALHGVRYFTGERSAVEVVFWVVCVAACMALSVYGISVVHSKWISTVSHALSVSYATPSWKAPFPAVSICPRNKSSEFGWKACNKLGGMASPHCFRTLKATTPALKTVVKTCRWNGAPLDVNDRTFSTVLSNVGVCYTFNILNTAAIFSESPAGNASVSWNLEAGLRPAPSWMSFPRRAVGNARRSGLFLTLRSEGVFKIRSIRHFSFYPLPDEEAVLTVSPAMTVSSNTLLSLDPGYRNCYFPTERKLLFFKMYTQRNCELECVANHTYEVCKCAPIYMPRLRGRPVCRDSDCYAHTTKDEIDADCDCLPSCSALAYDVNAMLYGWRRELDRWSNATTEEAAGLRSWAGLTRISIRIKDSTFTAVGRTMSYGRPEFLADCGGYLVLFSGFSIVTFIEVFFHLLIRWGCLLHKHRRSTLSARTP